MSTAVDRFYYLTDVELLARYARLVEDVERAGEHGAAEARERELRGDRDDLAVAVLVRMGRREEQ